MNKTKKTDRTRGERKRGALLSGACFALVLLLSSLILAALPVSGEEGVYRDVIRLHVLANSDGEEDQADKLAVRDAILSEYSDLFSSFPDRAAAEAGLTDEVLGEIAETAERTLVARGNGDAVSVTLTRERYGTREYGSFSLPAGEYRSLRVVIGEGEGRNWWCVLFPPLCAAAAIDGVPLGLSEPEFRLMTAGRVSVRFRTLELLSRWFS